MVMTPRVWLRTGVAWALTLVVGGVVDRTGVIIDGVSQVALFVAVLCCLSAALRTPAGGRLTWLVLALAMAMWAAADLIWALDHAGTSTASLLSAADWLYLLGLVPLAAALLFFPAGSFERGARVRLTLDVLVLGTAALVISQLLMLREVASRVEDTWEVTVLLAYPVIEVVLTGFAVLLVLRSSGRPRAALVLVALAFASWTVADNGYALASARGQDDLGLMVDTAYILGPLLLATAAVLHWTAEPTPGPVIRHQADAIAVVVPDIAVLGAVVVGIFHGLESATDWGLAAALLAFTTIRQFVVRMDNHNLRRDLARRVEERTRQLRWLADRHRRVLDSVADGILGVDAAGRVDVGNLGAGRLLGWSMDELVGRDLCTTLCAHANEVCPLAAAGDAATDDSAAPALLHLVRRDGGLLTAEASVASVTWPEGGHGTVIVFRDVTAREQVEQMKREFISSVSHELRTPLTAIHGSLEMLVDGDAGELPSSAHELAMVAERGSARLGRLVNDIIDVERLGSGTFRVTLSDHELPPLIESTAMLMQPRAQERGVDLVVGPSCGSVLCDPDRLTQVLVNLMDNALKFTHSGGTVRVDAAVREHDVVVSVSDEGRGIPAAELESIFAPFHQVKGPGSEDEGGTGLGLAITRSIVERHGGRIWVESEPGVGSTFAFTLSLVDDSATTEGAAPADPAVLIPVGSPTRPS